MRTVRDRGAIQHPPERTVQYSEILNSMVQYSTAPPLTRRTVLYTVDSSRLFFSGEFSMFLLELNFVLLI